MEVSNIWEIAKQIKPEMLITEEISPIRIKYQQGFQEYLDFIWKFAWNHAKTIFPLSKKNW